MGRYILGALLGIVLSPSIVSAQAWYLSPKIGTGTDANPFRAHQAGDWKDCANLETYFLCSGPSVPVEAGVITISVDKSSRLSAKQKTDLAAVTGKTVVADTIDDLITDIIDTKSIVIRPHKDNFQHIKIHGVEVWARPAPLKSFIPGALQKMDAAFRLPMRAVEYAVSTAVAWATSIAETFTATNGNLDGCQAAGCSMTWTEFNGTQWTIASNQASASAGGTAEARAESTLATDDHEITVTLVTHTAGSALDNCGPLARKDNSSTRTFYRMGHVFDTGSVDEHQFGYRSAGTATTLGTDATDYAASETLKIVVSEDQVSGYRNGVLMFGPTTDTTIAGNTYVGIQKGVTGTGGSCVLDDLSAQDVTAGRNRGSLWFN